MPVTPELHDVVATRRKKLRQWLDDHFGGSQTVFLADCAEHGHEMNQGELSGLLNKKSFGEKKARSLEMMGRMPSGYLDGIPASKSALTADGKYTASEPKATYYIKEKASEPAWPFATVTPKQYELLNDEERAAIEKNIKLFLRAREPTKRTTPATYIASKRSA